jgi:hypothetical protein
LENDLALEKKITEDIKQQNSFLVCSLVSVSVFAYNLKASQMESKQGDLGGLVAQVGKLTDQLHAQDKICSDLRTEIYFNILVITISDINFLFEATNRKYW